MELSHRAATLDDADLLLAWRNAPNVRALSQNGEVISIDEHLRWFLARLERVQFEPFFLFLEDQKVIGMTRSDLISEETDRFEISILIDPSQQGKRLGTKILDFSCKNLFDLYPRGTIIAKVHKANHVSQRLFLRAEFDLLEPSGDFLIFEKHHN